MCGIAGVFRLDRSPLPEDSEGWVRKMTAALLHRGPDGSGIYRSGPVCFGHRRLSIIDLATGSQPMTSHDQRFCITYNGELYNFAELKKELEELGAYFTTNSDTEVILESYRFFGTKALSRFEGMFAFALYDTATRTLFLARDRFGKKPLFYTVQNGCFYFASEITALATQSSLSLSLDPTSFIHYLAYEYVPAPETIYREVTSLPPAHFLMLSAAHCVHERYWEMPPPLKDVSEESEELCAQLRFLLTRAVKRRLISDVPLGVFLSGGLDSSIVTALMAQESTHAVKTFSIGFEEASFDESRYARLISELFATDHHEEILSAESCADLLPKIVQKMDVPMADASIAPTYLLAELTARHVTVALGGDGSDELWAGYENYAAFRIAQWYRRFPKLLRAGLIEPVSRILPASQGYVNLRLAMQTFLSGVYAPTWLGIQKLLTSCGIPLLTEILNHDFAEAHKDLLNEAVLFSSTRLEFEHWRGDAQPLARAFHVYVRQYLPEDILLKVDRCSMLHSLEVRAPFLDRDLAEFTARLPLSEKFYRLKGKKLLRKAMTGLLPKSILYRNKRGFQIPVAAWLRGRMRPLVEELLGEERLRKQGLFDPYGVRRLMDEHFKGTIDRRKQLWTLLVFQLWLDAHARRAA